MSGQVRHVPDWSRAKHARGPRCHRVSITLPYLPGISRAAAQGADLRSLLAFDANDHAALLPALRHALRGDGGSRTLWSVPSGTRATLSPCSRGGAIHGGFERDAPLPKVRRAVPPSLDPGEEGVSIDPRHRRTGRGGGAVVPVPLHWRRRRERGYNQAELLAKAIAKVAGRPCCAALVKVVPRPPQSGLSAGARRRNAAGAYRARLPAWLRRKRLLLVDDIFTTGATAEACTRALLGAGARSVDVLTVARVP